MGHGYAAQGARPRLWGQALGRTQTMPLAIYLGFEQNLALALSAVLLLASALVLALLRRLEKE